MEETTKTCAYCGKEFTTTDKKKKYCNAECRDKQDLARKKRKPEILKCPTCGRTFIRKGRKKYCSDSCRDSINSAKRLKAKKEAKIRTAAERRVITSHLAAANGAARDMNMTYGQYKAMQYMKKLEGTKL